MNTHKLKILHLTNTSRMGGVEAHLLSLLGAIDRSEFDVGFACLDDSAGSPGSLLPQLAEREIPAVCLGARKRLSAHALVKLASLMKTSGLDIVHVHLMLSELYGIPLARLMRTPAVVVSVHNRSRRYASHPTKLLARLNFSLADRVVAISSSVASHLSRHAGVPAEKLRVIHYGFDAPARTDTRVNGLRSELHLSPYTRLIGVVARLTPEKGHTYLLDAMPQVLAANKTAHLLVIGEDYAGLESELRARARRLRIDSRVSFLGFRSDIANILPQLDLFVLPSVTEGFGLALLEAMAVGLPIVATTAGAIPEIVEHGVTGLLVPPASRNPLAHAINQALARPEDLQKMGLAGRKRAIDRFSLARMVSTTEWLYREVAEEKGLVQ